MKIEDHDNRLKLIQNRNVFLVAEMLKKGLNLNVKGISYRYSFEMTVENGDLTLTYDGYPPEELILTKHDKSYVITASYQTSDGSDCWEKGSLKLYFLSPLFNLKASWVPSRITDSYS